MNYRHHGFLFSNLFFGQMLLIAIENTEIKPGIKSSTDDAEKPQFDLWVGFLSGRIEKNSCQFPADAAVYDQIGTIDERCIV